MIGGLTGLALALVLLAGCPGEVPAGGSCGVSGECQSGLQCLYALGSGCTGNTGHCDVPGTDCGGSAVGLVLCGCGEPLDLACIPASATLPQRTATGAACAADAGDAGDAADASDAADAGDAG